MNFRRSLPILLFVLGCQALTPLRAGIKVNRAGGGAASSITAGTTAVGGGCASSAALYIDGSGILQCSSGVLIGSANASVSGTLTVTSTVTAGAFVAGGGNEGYGILTSTQPYIQVGVSASTVYTINSGITTSSNAFTIQGNTFNGANNLVKLTAGGIMPAIDGSALTGISSTDSNAAHTNSANIWTTGAQNFNLTSSSLTVTGTGGLQVAGSNAPLIVVSSAAQNATSGGGTLMAGKAGTTAQSSNRMGNIDFVGGDGTNAGAVGARIATKSGGTWNTGSYRTHLMIGTAKTNGVDPELWALGVQDTQQVVAGTSTFTSGVPAGTGVFTVGVIGTMPQLAFQAMAQEPSSPVNGGWWYNSTQKTMKYEVAGSTMSVVGNLLTSVQVSTVSNTTTASDTIQSTTTLAANFWVAGKTLRLHMGGRFSDDAATPGTYQFDVKIGTFTVATTGAFTPTVSVTNKNWEIDLYLTCRSTGVSGTLVGNGKFDIPSQVAATGEADFTMAESALSTYDTTMSGRFAVVLTMGTADSDNVFVTQIVTLDARQ